VRGEHPFNPSSGSQDLRGCPLYEPGHLVIRTIPAADLDKPVSRPHIVAIRASRHVAVQQRIGERRVSRRELCSQLSAKAPNLGLDLSTRVVGHQAHDLSIDTLAAKEARTIQRVEPSFYQFGDVADVMQPGCRYKIIRQRQLFADPLSSASDRPDMPPPTWQGLSQHLLGQLSGFVNRDHSLDRTSTPKAGLHGGGGDSCVRPAATRCPVPGDL